MPKKTKAIPDNREERTFGETLYWHLFINGTRPDGSPARQGRLWNPKEAAGDFGISDRGLYNWIEDRHLPYDTAAIERAVFGEGSQYDEWREELRRLLRERRAAKAKPADKTGKFPAVLTGQAVTVHNTPFEVAEVDGPVTEADFRPPAALASENFGNSRKNQSGGGPSAHQAPNMGTAISTSNLQSGASTPASRRTVAVICAGVLVVLGIYGVKRVMELPSVAAGPSVPSNDPKPGPIVVKSDPKPEPQAPAPAPPPEAGPKQPTEQERRAAAEKKRQDDIRAEQQKKTLDELEAARLKKQQAAKDLNEKLRVMAQGDDDLCKQKLAGLSVPDFTLKCDTQIPFGKLLKGVGVSQTASSLGDCASRCRRAPDCVAFSFDAGAHTGSASCYLTGSIPEMRKADNWIAGTR